MFRIALHSAVIRLSIDAASHPWRRERSALWKLQNSLKNGLILYWNRRPYSLLYRQPLCGKDGCQSLGFLHCLQSLEWIITVQRTAVVTDWIITCFTSGSVLAQVVSYRLLTVEARFQCLTSLCWIFICDIHRVCQRYEQTNQHQSQQTTFVRQQTCLRAWRWLNQLKPAGYLIHQHV